MALDTQAVSTTAASIVSALAALVKNTPEPTQAQIWETIVTVIFNNITDNAVVTGTVSIPTTSSTAATDSASSCNGNSVELETGKIT
jgi:hypothetical protein